MQGLRKFGLSVNALLLRLLPLGMSRKKLSYVLKPLASSKSV